MEDYLDNTAV